MNRPVGEFGRTDQPMTMNSIQLSQTFPWPGRLGFGQERVRFLAEAESLDADEAEASLVARVWFVQRGKYPSRARPDRPAWIG